MARLAPEEGFELLKDRVQNAVSGLFPIIGRKNTLELQSVAVKDNLDMDDLRSQKQAKLSGRTWSVPVEAVLALKDNATGAVIDKQKMNLLNLPKVTSRFSHIVDGQEYQIDNQWRLKPGVYNMIKQDGALESHFNAAGGFKIHFDPKTRQFTLNYGNSNMPLKPFLHAMGVSDEEVEKSWGKDIVDVNHADSNKELAKFYRASTGDKATKLTPDEAKAHLWETMQKTILRPEVTKFTLGKEYTNVTGHTLLDASDKLLKISRGEAKPDPRDALMFKDLHSIEDFAAERIIKGSREILKKVSNNIDRKAKVRDIVAPEIFNRPIKQMFGKNSLAIVTDQTNPLEMISAQMKTTIMGDGGIKSEHTVSDDAKLIDPSHLGFLDPIHTPEGHATGITLRLPLGVQKIGHDVAVLMYNAKTGKNVKVNPTVAYKSHVVLPDQVTWVDGKPKAIGSHIKISGPANEIYEGSLKDADFVMKDPLQMFSISSNMIPFMPSDHPNRSTMAGRQMEQAISLKHREVPLVQSMAGKTSFDTLVGGFASHRTPVDGVVYKIKPDAIIIKKPNGEKKEVHIYDHFPLNEDKAFLHAEPIVKVGDTVKAQQVIADTNYTKNGTLAIGTNLRAGFMPYKGYNFDDGIVVSESAAKKLTSEHLHRHSLERDIAHILDRRKFQAYMPNALNKAQFDKLDEEGVVKPGTVIMPGDTLIAALRASNDPERREDLELSKLHKSIVKPYKDSSIKWDSDYPGVVKEVVKIGKNVAVHVKTEEQLDVGDKLCYAEEHELLTSTGWKAVADVAVTDLVCSLNPVTDEIEYLSPVKVVSYDCIDDDLYVLDTTQVSMAVTMEHKTYAKLRNSSRHELLPVSSLKGRRYRLKMHGKWIGTDASVFTFPALQVKAGQHGRGTRWLPEVKMSMDTFLMVLGMFLSEGNVYSGNGNHYIEICQIKQPNRRLAEEALHSAGIHFTNTPDKLRIHGKQLYEYFVQFGHAPHKFVPDWVFQLPPKRLRVLYKWLMWGDGYEKGSVDRYTSVSSQLADDVQRLLLHLGLAGRVITEPGYRGSIKGVEYDFKTRYRVQVLKTKLEPTINHGHVKTQSGQEEQVIKYTGKVYCVALPRNHVLYTRRKGKVHWSGNTGRHGNKGIVTKIVPDHDMPRTADGKHLEILLNPLGVTGRTNLGQVLEVAAAKIAEKTGKPYLVKNFAPGADFHAQVTADLAKHGLSDKEEIIDPLTNKKMGDVLVGPMHVFKLHHQVEKKLSSRAGGTGYAYDKNLIPKGGGPQGAKSLGTLGLYSMLAHGAVANLREMQTLKSDAAQGDQFWSALQAGEMLPTPKPTFAYSKFLGYIRGLGVNVQKTGNNLTLMPMTDKQIVEQSNGEITDPALWVTAKNMKPEIGGLFDPKITGGLEGTKWSHYTLPESLPNPVFESAIIRLLGIKQKEFIGLVGGSLAYDPKTGKIGDSQRIEGGLVGGKAFEHMLGKINVKKDLAAAKTALEKPTLKGTYLDHANSKVKLLQALDKVNMTPVEAYLTKTVPILPPSMRPLPVLPNGTISEEDLNGLYKNLHLSASRYAKMSPLIPDNDSSKVDVRQEMYDGLSALAGIGGYPKQVRRGILDYIHGKKVIDPRTGAKGGSPKEGFFQDQLVERKQDMSMRGTIIPEPSLGLDEVGLPKSAALEVYKPFVIRELRNLLGITPLQAQKKMAEGGEIVDRALEKVISTRPILLKRDPVLHKYGVQAFKPRIVGGKAVQVHPLVTSGFNADFDGDAMGAFVPISVEAVAEAHKMLPSRNLFSPSTGEIMYAPTNESRLGLYGIMQPGKDTDHKFANMQDMESAVRKGDIKLTDRVTVGGMKAGVGRFMVAGALPEGMRRKLLEGSASLDKKAQEAMFTEIGKDHKGDYSESANKLKDLGNMWSTNTAFSIGMKDIAPERHMRDKILAEADAKVHKLTGPHKDQQQIEIYAKATDEMNKHLRAVSESDNNLMLLHNVGMKGGTDTLRQIRAAPMLMSNHKGEIIPTPVRRSYSEGLDVADYWTAISGSRKGIIQKVQSVQEPGYISKQVMNSVMNNLIVDTDCGTTKGIALPVDEKDILDRFTAADIKAGSHIIKAGTLITPEIRSTLRNNNVGKVVVRSPLRCLHGPGICEKCYGLTENGVLPEKGLNVGVLAGQALGERTTQLALKAFHCSHAKSIVFVRGAHTGVLPITLEALFDLIESPAYMNGTEEVKSVSGWQVWDSKWVNLTHVRRHPPSRPMKLVGDGGLVTICQDNHPIGVWENKVRCTRCDYRKFKDPHKKSRQYCRRCGSSQEAPIEKMGELTFLPPSDLLRNDVYLHRDISPIMYVRTATTLDVDAYIAGMFLAEGSTAWKKSSKRAVEKPYQVQISQKSGPIQDKIMLRLRKAGCRPRRHKRYVEMDSLKLGTFFNDTFGRHSSNKHLPFDFLGYPTDWLVEMLVGLIDGDGTILPQSDGPDAINIDSTSFVLVQQIVLLCTRLGLISSIVATTIRKLTRHQGFAVRIRMTKEAKELLRASEKVRKTTGVSPTRRPEITGHRLVSVVKDVMYTDAYVYDATTETGTLYVSGIKHHNTGGTASSKSALVDDFSHVKNLLAFPKTLPGSATLSELNGKVTKIAPSPAGGHEVTVEGHVHYIPHSLGTPTYGGQPLKVGMEVKKGSPLSEGLVNPHEMLALTGIEPVQLHLASELHSAYAGSGIRRRNHEVVVKALTNLTKIKDPGSADGLIRGDFVSTAHVSNINRTMPKGSRPIIHEPILKGVNVLPLEMQEDWIAKLNHENLSETIIDAAQRGWTSSIHGVHPIPAIVYGAEIGKGKPGEY